MKLYKDDLAVPSDSILTQVASRFKLSNSDIQYRERMVSLQCGYRFIAANAIPCPIVMHFALLELVGQVRLYYAKRVRYVGASGEPLGVPLTLCYWVDVIAAMSRFHRFQECVSSQEIRLRHGVAAL